MKKIISVIITFIVLTCPAFAADWDDSSKTAMQNELTHMFDPYQLKDVDKMFEALPPGFLAYFARLHNATESEVEPRFRALMQAGVEAIKSMKFDYDATKIEYHQTSKGDLYALVPFTSHVVNIDDEATNNKSVSFAFKVNNRWYFVDLENPINIDAIKSVYPQFKDANFALSGQ